MKFVLCLAFLSLLVSVPGHAHEVEAGSVMVCDTKQQVERLAQLFDGNLEAAISKINGEENDPHACGVADVAYMQGEPIGTVRSKSHTFNVIPIFVLAVNTPSGYQPFQAAFFALAEVREYSV